MAQEAPGPPHQHLQAGLRQAGQLEAGLGQAVGQAGYHEVVLGQALGQAGHNEVALGHEEYQQLCTRSRKVCNKWILS